MDLAYPSQNIDTNAPRNSDNDDYLVTTNLIKRFPGVTALNKLNFHGSRGEVHAILGENGAGKSTFIKVLGGTVSPDEGETRFWGESITLQNPLHARSLGINVAFQELSLIPDLTVSENIWRYLAQPNRLGIFNVRKLRADTFDLYEKIDAPHIDPDMKVKYLPFAERQVIEIVKSLANEPQILILDEPTSSLPAEQSRWVLDLAKKIASQGTLVLFISHRLDEVWEVADRITVFRRGERVLTGSKDELSNNQIVEAMLGRKPELLYAAASVKPLENVSLRVQNLTFGHKLQDISFELHEQEILGVGGLIGQGQSELLLALFGMVPYQGEIEVGGKRAKIRSPRDAFHAGVGLVLVPEDRRKQGLMQTKSIRENIALPNLNKLVRWGLLSADKEHQLVKNAIERLDVQAASLENAVITLSGGNQQKIVVAKLLQVGAKVLLFHDLTRGIDVGTKAEIFKLARELTAAGYSILMYSSDNQELVKMCDRILVLSRGELAATLEGEDLTEEMVLHAALAIDANKEKTND